MSVLMRFNLLSAMGSGKAVADEQRKAVAAKDGTHCSGLTLAASK
jgi:hypothetical protein